MRHEIDIPKPVVTAVATPTYADYYDVSGWEIEVRVGGVPVLTRTYQRGSYVAENYAADSEDAQEQALELFGRGLKLVFEKLEEGGWISELLNEEGRVNNDYASSFNPYVER